MQTIFFPDSSWSPTSGWDRSFTETEKAYCANLYSFLRSTKSLQVKDAEKYAMMMVMKQKYHHLMYLVHDENRMRSLFTHLATS